MEVQITYYSYLNFLAICPQCRQKISHLAGTAIEEKVNKKRMIVMRKNMEQKEMKQKRKTVKREDWKMQRMTRRTLVFLRKKVIVLYMK